MNKPHVHAELIKKWADGAQIQVQLEQDTSLGRRGEWVDLDPQKGPGWFENRQYRVKPEVTTSLSVQQLRNQYFMAYGLPDVILDTDPKHSLNKALKAVADAALKQYIKDTENKA